jgi:amino acid permease
MRQILYATATLIGMMVGVGIFGVPYVTAKVGFILGVFWILFLGVVILIVHFFYSEVVLATPGKHRLVGYVDYHLGKFWKYLATVANIFNFWGAQIAYLIIGGKFLYLLLGKILGGAELVYNIIFFAIIAFCILKGLQLVEWFELGMTGLLTITIFSIFLWGLPKLEWVNFTQINFKDFMLPYGVVLFALGGAAAIPEMSDIVRKERQKLRKAILAGTLFSILITLVFVFTVVGLTGNVTTPEALDGLRRLHSNSNIIFLVIFFGILAIATSFLVLGLNLKNVFQYDYKLPNFIAWFLAVFVPFFVFLAGAKNFIKTIDLVGTVFGGLEGIIIAILFRKIFIQGQTPLKSNFWEGLAMAIILIFLIGIIRIILE